ncbi:MAG: 50S ribosomal protein L20 [Dehalococcoidia bacterium]|nr:50S ribosomal protein L20 [Dehalococcoidia bacterium]
MSRVKRGVTARRRHKKVLELTKGQWGTSHRLYRRAHEAMLHALSYAYRDRRDRKNQFRRLWITRINAAARAAGVSYSVLMHGLKEAGVNINRKMLADLAVKDATAFQQLVATATAPR